jgi:HPt (histidine-containing phosphotransfer) domain-containing protein
MSRFNGRKAFVAKLVASVLSHHAETPGRLRAAAAGAQREALTFMVHGLKGLSGNLLAPGLKALANAVDGELRSQGPLPLDHIEALARSLESVLAELAHPAILEGTAP